MSSAYQARQFLLKTSSIYSDAVWHKAAHLRETSAYWERLKQRFIGTYCASHVPTYQTLAFRSGRSATHLASPAIYTEDPTSVFGMLRREN